MKIKVLVKCVNYLKRVRRERWLKQLRKRNHNHDFSLISNDCVGGVIYHDLGEQFRSPTVNLWIPNAHFLAFVQNLEYYLSCEIHEMPDETKPYPVGTIIPKDDKHIPIEVNFKHYPSFEEAYTKWKERSKRVNYDRLYFIWHFYDDEHSERILSFDRWNARTLAILHEPLAGIRNSAVVSCYKEEPYNGKILSVIDKTGKRYLDDVDYIGFLSQQQIEDC